MKEGNKILISNLKVFIIVMIMPLLFRYNVRISEFGIILAVLGLIGLFLLIVFNLITGVVMLLYKDKLAPYHILSAILVALIGFSLCGGWGIF